MPVSETLCAGPIRGLPGFLADFLLTQMEGISADFHDQMLHGLLFLTLVIWAGEPCLGLRSLALQGDLCS